MRRRNLKQTFSSGLLKTPKIKPYIRTSRRTYTITSLPFIQKKPKEQKKQNTQKQPTKWRQVKGGKYSFSLINGFQANASPPKDWQPPLSVALNSFSRLQLAKKRIFNHKRVFSEQPDEYDWRQYLNYSPYQLKKAQDFLGAIKEGYQEKVQTMLSVDKSLVKIRDKAGLTPLHWVVKRANLYLAKVLIKDGADFDAVDMVGRTPLFLAVRLKYQEIAQVLIEVGANPYVKSLTGTTVFDIVQKNSYMASFLRHLRDF